MSGKFFEYSAICSLLFTIGCSPQPLGVRREIIGAWALPSAQLDTPDPKRKTTNDAERLVVRWHLPHRPKDGELDIHVRLGDARVETFRLPMNSRLGLWVHQWSGKEVNANVVIAAYRVDMWVGGQKIATRLHPLWCDPVQLEIPGGEHAS